LLHPEHALPHESLIAWQRADDLFFRIHQLSRTFPAQERFELGSQSRRAAFSVAANIVEGFGRYPPRERAQFLRIALASLTGLGYCIHVARRLDYISEETRTEIDLEMRRVAAPLRGLMRARGPFVS
jgi:four helix bundle protein